MPFYLNLLRDASTISIYILFFIVLFLRLFKGKIQDNDLRLFANIWLPVAVIAQILMTFVRKYYGVSNIPIANVFIMVELPILSFIMLRIRKRVKNIDTNYKAWAYVILGCFISHFFEDFSLIQKGALLFTVIIYFQITVSLINNEEFDFEKKTKFYRDPFLLLNAGIFLKAFGYSFFLIYNIDYKFPLSVYSLVNLGVQALFIASIIFYYKNKELLDN
jgi:hypothetical protein